MAGNFLTMGIQPSITGGLLKGGGNTRLRKVLQTFRGSVNMVRPDSKFLNKPAFPKTMATDQSARGGLARIREDV